MNIQALEVAALLRRTLRVQLPQWIQDPLTFTLNSTLKPLVHFELFLWFRVLTLSSPPLLFWVPRLTFSILLLPNGILLFFEDGRREVHQCEELCTAKAGARSSGRYQNFFSLAICIPTLSFCARNFAQRD